MYYDEVRAETSESIKKSYRMVQDFRSLIPELISKESEDYNKTVELYDNLLKQVEQNLSDSIDLMVELAYK